MFADLSDKLASVFKKLRGEARITESNINLAVKEVRIALLGADVNYKVVKNLIARVQERALGEEVFASVTPAQQFIKIINDELVEALGGSDYNPKINLSPNPPTIIMLSGLQGSGKTTTAGKLARFFSKSGKKVFLVAADIYRPAAIDQLLVVGKSVNVDVYADKDCKDAVKIASDGVVAGKKAAKEVIIIDTAGRLHIDDILMDEVYKIKNTIKPHYILYVADAMTGQDAVNAASAFDSKLDINAVILSKFDGDAKGGVALSIKEVTGKPLLFIGTGEKPDDFELFHPQRVAGRILGKGDIVTLVEKAGEVFDAKESEVLANKIASEGLNFDDMLKQFQSVKKMGSIANIAKMIPGMGKVLNNSDIDEGQMKKTEAIIYSMTRKERKSPKIINASRKKRIAAGSGRSVNDVNKLLQQLSQMNKMMKQMTKMMADKKGAAKNPMSLLKNMMKR